MQVFLSCVKLGSFRGVKSNLAGAPRSVKAGVRADFSNEVAGRVKPEASDFSALRMYGGIYDSASISY